MTIKIDKDRDSLLASYALGMLKDFYLHEKETSPQQAYRRAATAWSTYKGVVDEALAQRLYDYVSKKWFMFASPVLSNAPFNGEAGKALPISCFLTYVPDTLEGLIEHTAELRWLSVMGGGVGGHWSDVRTVSDVAPGPMPFIHTVDADMIAYRQGKTRKGSYAAYMDISHPDIIEFLNMRIPTGDVQRKALNLHNAINITDEFMEAVNEIHLPTDAERTAVCCLSSLNLEYYDDWKDTSIVRDLVRMLDNVLEYFIENAPDSISRARYSAARERSIGLGAMGFHSLLQKHGVAWESELAKEINDVVFKTIKSEAVTETELLAEERGAYLDGPDSGRRNSHLMAIAPNASSGVILSTSPSIEPLKANAYTHRTRAGSFLVKNKYLKQLIQSKDQDNDAIWTSIITNKGSVQHLPFLNEGEKAIFKTADEPHAADRQKYICQGQSVNIFFPAGADKSYVNQVHLRAWKEGLKGLYYLRTEAKQRAENVSEKVERVALQGDMRNIIYSKKNCPFCSMAKEELTLRGIPFDDIDLASVGKSAAEVTGRKDVKTVPQVYIAGEYVGGYNELMEFLNKPLEDNGEDEGCRSCEG